MIHSQPEIPADILRTAKKPTEDRDDPAHVMLNCTSMFAFFTLSEKGQTCFFWHKAASRKN
jgi:hypothetical protein